MQTNTVKFYNMENKIKETTEKLLNETITKDEADKILLDLHNVSNSLLTDESIDRWSDMEYPCEPKRAHELAWCVKKYRNLIKQ